MTRSGPHVPEGANAARAEMGVAAAPTPAERYQALRNERDRAERDRAEAIRRELARLTLLLHRHFDGTHPDNLLPALANPRDAEGARVFVDQIRDLARTLEVEARRDGGEAPTAGAIADLRRELFKLIDRFEDGGG